jgi:hypothetical protein
MNPLLAKQWAETNPTSMRCCRLFISFSHAIPETWAQQDRAPLHLSRETSKSKLRTRILLLQQLLRPINTPFLVIHICVYPRVLEYFRSRTESCRAATHRPGWRTIIIPKIHGTCRRTYMSCTVDSERIQAHAHIRQPLLAFSYLHVTTHTYTCACMELFSLHVKKLASFLYLHVASVPTCMHGPVACRGSPDSC